MKNFGNRIWYYRGMPCFLKVFIMPVCFYGRPVSYVPAFANHKKSKEDFQFYRKKHNMKIAFNIGLASTLQRRCTPNSENSAPTLLPWEPHSILTSCHSFELCERLRFTSIYSVHLLARCVLRSQTFKRGYFLDLEMLESIST